VVVPSGERLQARGMCGVFLQVKLCACRGTLYLAVFTTFIHCDKPKLREVGSDWIGLDPHSN